MKIGEFEISWEELKEADKGLVGKKKLHPCRDDQSRISWWYELELTDKEILVIAVSDVLFDDVF